MMPQTVDKIDKRVSDKYTALVVAAGRIKGVHIPFISLAPNGSYDGYPLLMFNDTGLSMDKSVENIMSHILDKAAATGIKGPVIIPILPTRDEFNDALTAAGSDFKVGNSRTLCRECFSPMIPPRCKFYHLEKQIDTILDTTGIDGQFVGFGHGDPGTALMRYVMLSPDRFCRIVVGSNADCVPIVTGNEAKAFDYPIGVRDRDVLFGRPYHKSMYHHIDYEFYISNTDDRATKNRDRLASSNYENGCSGWETCPADIAGEYRARYGDELMERFYEVMNDYDGSFLNVHLHVYDGEPHRIISVGDFCDVVYGVKTFENFPAKQVRDLFLSKVQ